MPFIRFDPRAFSFRFKFHTLREIIKSRDARSNNSHCVHVLVKEKKTPLWVNIPVFSVRDSVIPQCTLYPVGISLRCAWLYVHPSHTDTHKHRHNTTECREQTRKSGKRQSRALRCSGIAMQRHQSRFPLACVRTPLRCARSLRASRASLALLPLRNLL